jgi:putative membrane protein
MANDPRIFFAAERTLLAWVRTGLTIVALGFVVERFGLFLRLLALEHPQAQAAETGLSTVLGVALVAAGSLTIAVGAVQHRRYLAHLPAADRPPGYHSGAATLLALLIAAFGLALAIYLAS